MEVLMSEVKITDKQKKELLNLNIRFDNTWSEELAQEIIKQTRDQIKEDFVMDYEKENPSSDWYYNE
jgi:hypothetical protein